MPILNRQGFYSGFNSLESGKFSKSAIDAVGKARERCWKKP